jgi:hypothetical protein
VNRIKNIFIIGCLTTGVLLTAESNIKNNTTNMFENAKVTGEVRSMYAGYKQKHSGEADTHATSIGGKLKYETAELNGFSAATAVNTSYDIGFLSGEREKSKHFDDLSSADEEYMVFSEVYLNYKNGAFNFRAGRQIINTPLADTDDYRMIANTFEAYIATYEMSKFTFMVGNLQEWQGIDAGLDAGWEKTGEDGTWLGSVTYATDILEASAWYYDINKKLNALYLDATLKYEINNDMSIETSLQYLDENEQNGSGEEATIYGAMVELSAYDAKFSLAHNNADKRAKKTSFSGYGGGALFTSMNIMILDEITNDRDSKAVVLRSSYDIGDASVFYAYGDFNGDADSNGVKAHIVEQKLGIEYSIIKDKLNFLAIYTTDCDKISSEKTANDWDLYEMKIAYNF